MKCREAVAGGGCADSFYSPILWVQWGEGSPFIRHLPGARHCASFYPHSVLWGRLLLLPFADKEGKSQRLKFCPRLLVELGSENPSESWDCCSAVPHKYLLQVWKFHDQEGTMCILPFFFSFRLKPFFKKKKKKLHFFLIAKRNYITESLENRKEKNKIIHNLLYKVELKNW